jgi:plasmid stabilization system protein ParE
MVKRPVTVVIDNEAKYQLKSAYDYIKRKSPLNAEKVKSKILTSFKKLSKNPNTIPPDRYKLNNDGSYRAYELFKYRISYQIGVGQINIIRIRHTKMNPLHY